MQTSIAQWLTKPAVVKEYGDTVALDGTPSISVPAAPTAHETERQQSSTVQPAVQQADKRSFGQTPRQPLPPQVSIGPITAEFIPPFRRLNSLLFPIPYQDKFFKDTTDDPVIASISRAALWTSDGSSPRLVGAIRCRLLATHDPAAGPSLYISTIGTLAPYRSHGLATALLEEVLRSAVDDYGASSVTAHAWVANDEGLEWYARRGFKEVGREEGYYKRLTPSTAVLIRRDVSVMDMLPPGNVPDVPNG